jgi:D-beta-D-heptose 7-phosphate kinase/D-beta-D-heptose 1-phosphate adenosyltransferase
MRNLQAGPPARPRGYADAPELADAVGRLAGASLLVIGDATLDRYVCGRLTPAGAAQPVALLGVEREVALPGGSANLVRHLTAVGASVAFVSLVGDDQAGSDLTGLIGGQPRVEPWLLVQGGRATTVRTTYIAAGRQILRADQEDVRPIQPKLAERLLRIARDALAGTAAIVLSDHGKGVLSGDLPAQLIAVAHQARRKVIVVPSETDWERYAGADLLVLGAGALPGGNGLAAGAPEPVPDAARLREQYGFGAVAVLRGAAGITGVDGDGAFDCLSGSSSRTEGAIEDAMLATIAAGLAVGLEMRLAIRLASVAADIVASRPGAATVAAESDLLQALA